MKIAWPETIEKMREMGYSWFKKAK